MLMAIIMNAHRKLPIRADGDARMIRPIAATSCFAIRAGGRLCREGMGALIIATAGSATIWAGAHTERFRRWLFPKWDAGGQGTGFRNHFAVCIEIGIATIGERRIATMSKFQRNGLGGPLVGVALASLLLAGCDQAKEPGASPSDPAMSGALGDQIMVDPDMAGEDGAALAADDGEISLPPEDTSADAIAAARKQAASVAGGKIKPAPQALPGGVNILTESAATAAQVAAASKTAKTDCTAKLDYSNTWAAKLPGNLPIYPRGAVKEAAGVDKDGCAMVVVNYATAVSPQEVMAFYYTMAGKAGYGAEHRSADGQYAMGGRKGSKAYIVYANRASSGVTEVNLVTSGK